MSSAIKKSSSNTNLHDQIHDDYLNPSPSPHTSANHTPELNREREICKKCNNLINEGHAYELGEDRWHIDCFNCSKCDTSLGCNSNFLVLGNGNLICSNCSYNCKQCGRKIDDLAILTGDQAYCSNCFKCRSCKNKIEDLRYARTSKGLFCMDCHEKLMAKKKKYDAKKKQLALLQQKQHLLEREQEQEQKSQQSHSQSQSQSQDEKRVSAASSRNSLLQSYMFNNRSGSSTSFYGQENNSLSSLASHKNKTLPKPPPEDESTIVSPAKSQYYTPHSNVYSQETLLKQSPLANYTTEPPRNKIQPAENDFSIEEVHDSSDSDSSGDGSKRNGTSLRNKSSATRSVNHFSTPTISNENPTSSASEELTDLEKTIYLDIGTTPSEKEISQLRPAAAFPGPNNINLQTPQQKQHSMHSLENKSKNLLILSPNQYHDNEFHNATMKTPSESSPNTLMNLTPNHRQSGSNLHPHGSNDENSRSAMNSPFAKGNRQARVVETIDDITNDDMDRSDILPQVICTPQQEPRPRSGTGISLSSPPPKLPLPSTPSKKNPSSRSKFDESMAHGLGLEGVTYEVPEAGKPPMRNRPSRERVDTVDRLEKHRSDEAHVTPVQAGTLNRMIGNVTPAVTNLEGQHQHQHQHQNQHQNQSQSQPHDVDTPPKEAQLSRKSSVLRTLKHKRTKSGNTSSKFAFFKSPKDEASSPRQSSHTRHISEGSVMSNSGNYSALNSTSNRSPISHMRSTSDSTAMYGEVDHYAFLKPEVQKLLAERNILDQDVKKLKNEKLRLVDELKSLQHSVASESSTYETLIEQIKELKADRSHLTDENQELTAQNRVLESRISERSSSLDTDSFDMSTIANNNSFSSASPMRDLRSEHLHFPQHHQHHQQHHHQHHQQFLHNGHNLQNSAQSEEEQPQKATKLKFWRRGKVGAPQVVATSQGENPNSASRLPNSLSSNALRVPANGNNNGAAGNVYGNGKFTKSVSTNILDSFLGGDSNGSAASTPGSSLFNSTIQQRAGFEKTSVPFIISRCLKEVEDRGLDYEGIYRVSGGSSAIVAIENAFANLNPSNQSDEKQFNKVEDLVTNGDIHAVTSALKRYLRKLPDPIVPYVMYDEFIRIGQSPEDMRVKELVYLVKRLPPANHCALSQLCLHLHKVNDLNHLNRMGYKNLSVVFAPTLARDRSGEREMTDMGLRNDVTELLLRESERIFT
ncbi:uncharacterized protein LODBEIA_P50060 [Lodderomyces beijingensis]|uniref:RhoGAP-domain-containing protein n=1 Tax=Lodderomyces beijingensis TaxID=1775926 RepID=A0ABP0ZRN5_9ASCO